MSEKPEEELDLEKIQLYDTVDLREAIEESLIDYDYEICYMNGKTLKIRDFFDLRSAACLIHNQIQNDYLKELTCSLKKNLQPVKTGTK
jgi:hypothetical protein